MSLDRSRFENSEDQDHTIIKSIFIKGLGKSSNYFMLVISASTHETEDSHAVSLQSSQYLLRYYVDTKDALY